MRDVLDPNPPEPSRPGRLDHLMRRVEWFNGVNRDGVEGRGTVIGFCEAPQVLIETEDGRRVWWRLDLTRDVTCGHCGGTGIEPKE